MKERPILFSGEMVRAIMEGRKTMTRRVMNLQPSEDWQPYSYNEVHKMRDGEFVMRHGGPVEIGWGPSNEDGSEAYKCPYGQPGDRLWVKETFLVECSGSCRYDAEGLSPGEYPDWLQKASVVHYSATTELKSLGKWKSPRFMPRWASRIMLEVVSVRVESLNAISQDDALSEGITPCNDNFSVGGTWHNGIGVFRELWDSIHGKIPDKQWDANPWVWVIEFKRVKP